MDYQVPHTLGARNSSGFWNSAGFRLPAGFPWLVGQPQAVLGSYPDLRAGEATGSGMAYVDRVQPLTQLHGPLPYDSAVSHA